MKELKEKIRFEKYSSYKSTDTGWLGDIPSHWELLSNKYIFNLKKTQVGKKYGDFVLLSLTLNGVIKRDMENPQGKFPAEFDTYQEVKKGNFIFCLFDVEETPRAVGLSDYDGMITGAYTVMESKAEYDKRFLYYFYLNLDADKRMRSFYKGLRNTIPKESFFSFKTFVPPPNEQSAIASFLDRKTTQIEKAISIKEKQIELLRERRQILIHNAITRGLNPNVKMKDSGVEWIGEIPEHWKICSLNYIAKIGTGSTPDRSRANYWNGNIPWVKTGEVNYTTITETEEYITELGLKNSATRLAPVGTILMAMYGQGVTRGRIAILGIPATFNQACCSIQFNDSLSTLFGFYFFIAAYSNFRDAGNETSQMNLSSGYISKLKILIPPKSEQEFITKYLKATLEKVLTAINCKEKEIEKLKEYKATLINSAVTGKIKVS